MNGDDDSTPTCATCNYSPNPTLERSREVKKGHKQQQRYQSSNPLPLSLLMSSGCVLPLDIHAIVRDSSTPMGTATTARRSAARISYTGSLCRDAMISACNPEYTTHRLL